jgi:mRNA-degrading endonuclease RelE of RelBE toxin-antitoxin system
MELMKNDITILVTNEFKKNLKKLAKKYRNIKLDLNQYISVLQSGEIIGEQIIGIEHKVYKLRIPNRKIMGFAVALPILRKFII